MDPGRYWLADQIDAGQTRILAQYQTGLETLVNALVKDEVALEQALENARLILADVSASLRADEVRVADSYQFIAWDIGLTRAAGNVHPSESLQASSVFFHAVLTVVSERLQGEPDAGTLTAKVALALERSITMRVRTAMAGYTSFLLNQVHDAQLVERRRIARDLHDRIGRSISLTHRQLELFNVYQDRDPEKASQKVAAAQHAVIESMQSLRAVTSDLYAAEPVKSLDKALRNYLDGVAGENVALQVNVNGDEAWATPEVLDETFLVLREAAYNALYHAAPSVLIINIDITPQEIMAYVEDDGCGFDAERRPQSGGMGIASMLERARLLDATLTIGSRVGHGTHVRFTVPLRGPLRG
jgi:signal transduction histidine kinase